MKLPEPIIFTKEARKGIAVLIQLILELSIVIGVFIAGLASTIKLFGMSWISVYVFLFIVMIFLVAAIGHYS